MHKKQTTSRFTRSAQRAGSWARGDDRSTLEERLLTADEVARLLHVSRSMIYHLTDDGDLPYIQVGSLLRFRPNDVKRFLRTFRLNAKLHRSR